MVKETRIIFGVQDMVGVRLTCRECGNGATLTLRDSIHMPTECPFCHARWRNGENTIPAQRLIDAVRMALREDPELFPVTPQFELNDPSDD